MAFPAGLPLVTLEFQFDTPPDGGVAFGSVRVTSPQALQGPADNSMVPVIDKVVPLSASGSGSIRLPVVDAAGWTPQDWAYSITANVNGTTPIRGTLQLFTADSSPVNLADRLQLTSSTIVPGVTYATLAQLTAGLATKADLAHTHTGYVSQADLDAGLATKAALVHTHAIVDVTGLTAALAGKAATVHTHTVSQIIDFDSVMSSLLSGYQPVGEYLVAADITDLVSYDTLQEALEDFLPKVGPVVTDSTFTVVRTAGGAARWRSTGGALDIDVVGDVIESRFANQDFSGAQTPLRRMRGNGNTLAGLTEFGSTVYAGEQFIDGVGGVAALGAKNSAANLRLCGYLDISTAPVSGTWAVGDVVETRVGRFRCTVAGTPGTWRWLNPSEAMNHGFAGWMGDPAQIQAATIITTGGTPYVWRFRADAATVSAMNLHITTPGSGLTNAFWTLHNDDGTILSATAKSANQNTNLQTGGERTMPMTPQVVTPGQFYRARFWVTGTTLPTVSRMCSSSNAAINAGGVLWYSSAAGGLTDLASAPDTIGTLSTTLPTVAWWAGWKA